MTEAALKRLRATVVVAVLLIAVVALAALCFVRRDSGLQVQWDSRSWHFGAYKRLDSMEGVDMDDGTVSGSYTTLVEGYQVGPLNVFTAISPQPLGTNAFLVGDRLFDPMTTREVWKVLATERNHEFDDGIERDAVRARDLVNGGEAWVPRSKLSKALLVRERQ
jgi:hypothetical protein